MPIIANQERNLRDVDFETTYPSAVVVCTDLPSSVFPGEADENWVVPNVSVAIGTFLGLETRDEVDEAMDCYRDHGLRILALDECSTHDILSAKVEKAAEKMVRTVSAFGPGKQDAVKYRIVGMLMADIFKKTAMVRYCGDLDEEDDFTRRYYCFYIGALRLRR